jgi:hypothetical protein
MGYYWKIVDMEGRSCHTLFHGHPLWGRYLPKNVWLEAQTKLVTDGSGGKKYLSGWHIMKSYRNVVNYLNVFTNVQNKAAVMCLAAGVSKKHHSRSDVYLAKWIYIVSPPIKIRRQS